MVDSISRSHLQRILQAGDVRPHRVRQSVVLSIDEKTGIQALERKHANRAPGPGRARRREFEYTATARRR